ncbi:Crp/Fnr family transcriptional regulator [Flammeovirgaceae bacterium SG7u.111]|nr:Crp/Fnr family transcriptional regulator [Flammeovirgaceae bacterium SG7u.132]WPO36534.1 Crp/Fnr family transcriptional regulator [Flammeovirgaceae bacterium SG7u.111]
MESFLIDTFKISKHEAELFSSCFERKVLNPGEKFVSFGRVSHKIGFVEEGLLKCILIKDEKSVIDDFAFPNNFVANYYSFLKNEPSNKDIICLKKSVLRITTREKLAEFDKKNPFTFDLARKVAEKLFLSTHEKWEDLRLLSAEERYLKLIRTNKKITAEIPQYEIASYLNVSPETVSRIRRKIVKRS